MKRTNEETAAGGEERSRGLGHSRVVGGDGIGTTKKTHTSPPRPIQDLSSESEDYLNDNFLEETRESLGDQDYKRRREQKITKQHISSLTESKSVISQRRLDEAQALVIPVENKGTSPDL